MGRLVVEIKRGDGGWQRLGALSEDDPSGTMSSHSEQGRDVILFECLGEYSTVSRSIAGGDAESADRSMRVLSTVGLQELAHLGPGQEFELDVRTDRMAVAGRVRWRHEEKP